MRARDVETFESSGVEYTEYLRYTFWVIKIHANDKILLLYNM